MGPEGAGAGAGRALGRRDEPVIDHPRIVAERSGVAGADEVLTESAWLKSEAPLEDGRRFTLALFEQWFDEEAGLLAEVPNIAEAARLMHNMIIADDLVEFLTLTVYELLG